MMRWNDYLTALAVGLVSGLVSLLLVWPLNRLLMGTWEWWPLLLAAFIAALMFIMIVLVERDILGID